MLAPTPAPTDVAAEPGAVTIHLQLVPAGTQAELGFSDSLDGSTDDVMTVPISFRGHPYEVDLSREHRQQLQAALAPFFAVARAAGMG